ncbi:hypothetical protein [Streptomyces monomycini]|uniref:hypothetical protein n=1 Tax=Streptomyces monomycini TaxID=371720 RepID=UPI0004AA725D|nr:hypothetical protein [Streptomyces monomycini]
MTVWAATTVVTVAHRHDRVTDQAKIPFGTRFGRCLARHLDGLKEEDRTDPVAFAIWAWSVATAPVMRPDYVCIRPDLSSVRLIRSQDNGRLLVRSAFPFHTGSLLPTPVRRMRYATGSPKDRTPGAQGPGA